MKHLVRMGAVLACLAFPAAATAQAPSLNGQLLSGIVPAQPDTALVCSAFTASGFTGAPYVGTFTESGTFTIVDGFMFTGFESTFRIEAFDGTVVEGSKRGILGPSAGICEGQSSVIIVTTGYTATITRPDGSTCQDSGTSEVLMRVDDVDDESFVEIYSSDAATVPCSGSLPTTKEQCKNGGWKNYGTKFKNQGDCVSFVATRGKNAPAG